MRTLYIQKVKLCFDKIVNKIVLKDQCLLIVDLMKKDSRNSVIPLTGRISTEVLRIFFIYVWKGIKPCYKTEKSIILLCCTSVSLSLTSNS